jgi:hypothetical protein
MEVRMSDAAAITFDRKIPLWGILTLAGALIGQGVLLWSGAREAAIEQKHMGTRVEALTVEIKSLSNQVMDKNIKDLSQDGELKDMARRVEALERTRK